MPRSLIKKGDADTLAELYRGIQQKYQRRDALLRKMKELLWEENTPEFPEDVKEQAQVVHGGIPRSIVRWLAGLYASMPQSRWYALDGSQADMDRAQRVEDFHNQVWKNLQRQSGEPTYWKVVESAIAYGWGVERLDLYPRRYGTDNGFPDPDDPDYLIDDEKDDAPTRQNKLKAWGGAMSRATRRMAVRRRLPFGLAHVPSDLFWWNDDPEIGGMTLAVEVRYRQLKDLLEDDRYADGLKKVRKLYSKELKGLEGAINLMAKFVVIQDRSWCAYLALPAQPSDLALEHGGATNLLQGQFQAAFGEGELAGMDANELEVPGYVVTPGLESESSDPALRYRSCFFDVAEQSGAIDAILSYEATRLKDFLFPAAVITNAVQGAQQQMLDAGDEDGGEYPEITLARGAYKATELGPGQAVQFVTAPPPSQDELRLVEQLWTTVEMNSIPRALTSGQQGASGYYFQSLLESGTRGYRPLKDGFRTGHDRRTDLVNTGVLFLGQDLQIQSLGTVVTRPGKRTAAFLAMKPSDIEDFDLSYESIVTIDRPAPDAQDIQNYMQSTQSGAYTRPRAREIFLHEEESDHIERELLYQQYLDDPSIRQIRIQQVAKKVNQALVAQEKAQQANVDPSQLEGAPPALLESLAQRAQPGTPVHDAVMQALQQQQGGATSAPNALGPGGAPMPQPQTPSTGGTTLFRPGGGRAPVPGGGGRAAGSPKRPGGPRRVARPPEV